MVFYKQEGGLVHPCSCGKFIFEYGISAFVLAIPRSGASCVKSSFIYPSAVFKYHIFLYSIFDWNFLRCLHYLPLCIWLQHILQIYLFASFRATMMSYRAAAAWKRFRIGQVGGVLTNIPVIACSV